VIFILKTAIINQNNKIYRQNISILKIVLTFASETTNMNNFDSSFSWRWLNYHRFKQ